jgi:hypothetical protein
MRRFVLAVALTALMIACKKDKGGENTAAGSGTAAASPTAGGSAATTPPAVTPPTTPPAMGGERPAKVTDAQVAALDKLAVEVEALSKDAAAAGGDCGKIAGVIKSHEAALKAAGDAVEAAKLDESDPAVKVWVAGQYTMRLGASAAAWGMAMAKCATDKAFQAAAAGLDMGKLGMEAGADAMDNAGEAMDKAGEAMDKAGEAMDKAGKAADEANK